MKFNVVFCAITLTALAFFRLTPALAVEGEIGPLEFNKTYSFLPSQGEQALRVESFGRTVLKIKIRNYKTVYVEGPLPSEGREIPLGKASGIWKDLSDGSGSNAKVVDLTLERPGVYRIVASSVVPRSQALSLAVKCSENCFRKSVPVSEVFAIYFQKGGHESLLRKAQAEVSRLVPSFYSFAFQKELKRIVETQDFKALDRFPTIPLSSYRLLRAQMSNLKDAPIRKKSGVTNIIEDGEDTPKGRMRGHLEDLLGPCSVPRTQPVEIHPAFPALRYGHFPNLALTACQNAHSVTLARLLTALGENQNEEDQVPTSWVVYEGKKYFTPATFIEALLRNKHQVEMRHERTYANFLSMTIGGEADLLWPVWIDTGLVVKGQPLVIPSGHSQHVWRISGPTVNTTVSFFMGMFGAGFQSQTSTRPAWTGPRTDHFVTTSVAMSVGADEGFQDSYNVESILTTFRAAHDYLLLNRRERETVGKGLPSDGYGYLGICNDSDGFLEMVSRKTCGGYPLVRDSELNKRLRGPLGEILKSLPDDTDQNVQASSDVLRRIYNMRPYELTSPLWIDPLLREQMAEIKALVDSE